MFDEENHVACGIFINLIEVYCKWFFLHKCEYFAETDNPIHDSWEKSFSQSPQFNSASNYECLQQMSVCTLTHLLSNNGGQKKGQLCVSLL